MENNNIQNINKYIILDIETTGLSPTNDKIIEIAAIKVENNEIVERFDTMVDPQIPIPYRITNITGIDNSMVLNAPIISNVISELYDFIQDLPLVAHNAPFDIRFISHNLQTCGYCMNNKIIDTLKISRDIYPHFTTHKLDAIAKMLNIDVKTSHRAMADVETLHQIFNIMLQDISKNNYQTRENIDCIYCKN